MPDLSHQWGSDLSLSPTGDLALADGTLLTRQRLLRRLLTNQGDYIWQRDYGAGLASFVGEPGQPASIAALMRGQVSKEPGVAQTPAPDIEVSPIFGTGPTGGLSLSMRYADADTSATQALSFTVGG
jgi:hypothetical protein